MLDKTNRAEFIREGLVRYADARDTVNYFQASVLEAIFASFDGKTSWKNFEPRRDLQGNLETGKFIGTGDRYIQGWVAGSLPNVGTVWLGLGLFWKPSRRPASPVVAACHAWADKGVPIPLSDVAGRDQQVLLGALYKKNERRLFLEPGSQFDPREAFSQLLDSADDALAP